MMGGLVFAMLVRYLDGSVVLFHRFRGEAGLDDERRSLGSADCLRP